MRGISTLIMSMTALSVASGCAPSIAGGPVLTSYQAKTQAYFDDGFNATRISDYHAATTPNQQTQKRNSIVLSAIGSIDIQYARFVSSLTREGQILPFAATLASISLSGAGTLVGSAVAKTTLAAVDTGLKGGMAAYDKNVLAERTVQSLQKQMQANRNRVRSSIISKLAEGPDTYPLELAMLDVNDYASAGTITAGLAIIDEQASTSLAVSEDEKVDRIYAYAADEATAEIIGFMNTKDPVVLSAVEAAAAKAGVLPPSLIYDAAQAANRRKLLTVLKALPLKPK